MENKPQIIVEVCQNHCGDQKVLSELIHAAAENGADIIKGQIIFTDDLTHRERFDTGETDDDGIVKTMKRPFDAEYNRLKALDLTEDDYRFFVEEVYKAGAIPMLTVFSRNRIPLALSLPWKGEKYVKVASYDCASFPMIRELADGFDKMIVSTGATFDEEIKETAAILKEKGKDFAFTHCVTSYPNTLDMAHLARMEWLKQFTPHVGWSDHTLVARDGIKAAKVALMLGAEYIERHFRVLAADATKDGPISIDPALLKELSDFRNLSKDEQKAIVEKEIPEWQTIVGQKERDLTHTELINRDYYRGRFASKVGGDWVYNWDDAKAF
jgi:sialic acid synthase SpsE